MIQIQTCEGCNGKGVIKCPLCKGSGRVTKGGLLMGEQVECPHCAGIGEVVCRLCGGVGKLRADCSDADTGGGPKLGLFGR